MSTRAYSKRIDASQESSLTATLVRSLHAMLRVEGITFNTSNQTFYSDYLLQRIVQRSATSLASIVSELRQIPR